MNNKTKNEDHLISNLKQLEDNLQCHTTLAMPMIKYTNHFLLYVKNESLRCYNTNNNDDNAKYLNRISEFVAALKWYSSSILATLSDDSGGLTKNTFKMLR